MNTTMIKNWTMGMMTMAALCISAPAETLGDMLRTAGWDKIIGTWVDADTKGKNIRVKYAWKYEDHAIQVTSKMGEIHSTGLIGRNAATGEVFMSGINSKGGATLGKWVEEDGDAVLEAGFVSDTGEEGTMRIRHHLKDDNTMVVTIPREEAEDITITLVRKTAPKKEKKPGRKEE